jgi:hypothetical protein
MSEIAIMSIGDSKAWRVWRNIGGRMGKEKRRREEIVETMEARRQTLIAKRVDEYRKQKDREKTR